MAHTMLDGAVWREPIKNMPLRYDRSDVRAFVFESVFRQLADRTQWIASEGATLSLTNTWTGLNTIASGSVIARSLTPTTIGPVPANLEYSVPRERRIKIPLVPVYSISSGGSSGFRVDTAAGGWGPGTIQSAPDGPTTVAIALDMIPAPTILKKLEIQQWSQTGYLGISLAIDKISTQYGTVVPKRYAKADGTPITTNGIGLATQVIDIVPLITGVVGTYITIEADSVCCLYLTLPNGFGLAVNAVTATVIETELKNA